MLSRFTGENMTVERKLKREIRRHRRKLDNKMHRTIKGPGDLIGGFLAGGGALVMVGAIACADSVPTEDLYKWGAVMIFSITSLLLGVKILNFMRS